MRPLAIVTGGSRGIGLAVAARLQDAGFDLLLISRNAAHLDSAAANLRQRTDARGMGAPTVDTAQLDLGDFSAVRDFVAGFRSRWNLLINNAGIKINADAGKRDDGLEPHMAINHLGHVLLVEGLLPTAAERARIVWVSSIVARFSPRDPFAQDLPDVSARYAASKAANLAYALELDERLVSQGSQVRSVAAHPGFTKADPYGTRFTRIAETLMAQSCAAGAGPIVSAALGDSPNYLAPRWFELWGKAKPIAVPQLIRSNHFIEAVWTRSRAAVALPLELT